MSSLCYDFEKWTMITLATIAVSLTVGLILINIAHGQETHIPTTDEIRQTCLDEMTKADEMYKARENYSMLDSMMDSIIPLNSRVDLCVNMITQGLNAQGITIR